jgi:hypothetical protein
MSRKQGYVQATKYGTVIYHTYGEICRVHLRSERSVWLSQEEKGEREEKERRKRGKLK